MTTGVSDSHELGTGQMDNDMRPFPKGLTAPLRQYRAPHGTLGSNPLTPFRGMRTGRCWNRHGYGELVLRCGRCRIWVSSGVHPESMGPTRAGREWDHVHQHVVLEEQSGSRPVRVAVLPDHYLRAPTGGTWDLSSRDPVAGALRWPGVWSPASH